VTCKLTYRFRDIASSTDDGWSEQFFIGSGDAETALAIATAAAWLNERLAFLMTTYMLASITAQNVANRFDNARMRFTQTTGVGQYREPGGRKLQGEAPWTGVLVNFKAGTSTAANKTIRGIVSTAIGDNLEYEAPPSFNTAFTTWLDDLSLAPNAYQIRKSNLGAGLTNPTSLTVQPDRRGVQLVYPAGTAPATLTPRAIVSLAGVQSASPVNGLWRVQSNDLTLVTLYPKRRTIFGVPSAPTVVKILTFTYFSITDSEIIRGAERKAGRPQDQLRGRARVRQG
jgi:hypothetical protein